MVTTNAMRVSTSNVLKGNGIEIGKTHNYSYEAALAKVEKKVFDENTADKNKVAVVNRCHIQCFVFHWKKKYLCESVCFKFSF